MFNLYFHIKYSIYFPFLISILSIRTACSPQLFIIQGIEGFSALFFPDFSDIFFGPFFPLFLSII